MTYWSVLQFFLAGIITAITLAGEVRAAPKVTFAITHDPVEIDISVDHRRLKAMMMCERPAVTGKFLGLATGTVQAGFTYQVAIRTNRNGVAASVIAVNITLHLKDRRVYIARELPVDSCSYGQTLGHEMRHVEIDETIVGIFRSQLQKAAQQAVADLGTVRAKTAQDATSAIYRVLDTVLEREMAALQAMRRQRQSALDNAEEYRRLSRACHGQSLALIEAAIKENAGQVGNRDGWYEPAACDIAASPPNSVGRSNPISRPNPINRWPPY